MSEKGAQDVHSKKYLSQSEIDERAKRKAVGLTSDVEEKTRIEERKKIGLSGAGSGSNSDGNGDDNNKKSKKKIVVNDEQFGKKAGKHCRDYGLDPSKKEDRDKLLFIINDIIDNYDEVVRGEWRSQSGMCDMFIKGSDVVIANNGKFVTILKGGVSNARIKKARR